MSGEQGVIRSIERANQRVRRYLAKHLEQLGVTEIEAHLPSTLTNALDRLERRRFLRRKSDPRDRRTFVLELTAAGKRAAREVIALVDSLEARVEAQVSDDQLEAFRTVIAALEDALS